MVEGAPRSEQEVADAIIGPAEFEGGRIADSEVAHDMGNTINKAIDAKPGGLDRAAEVLNPGRFRRKEIIKAQDELRAKEAEYYSQAEWSNESPGFYSTATDFGTLRVGVAAVGKEVLELRLDINNNETLSPEDLENLGLPEGISQFYIRPGSWRAAKKSGPGVVIAYKDQEGHERALDYNDMEGFDKVHTFLRKSGVSDYIRNMPEDSRPEWVLGICSVDNL